MCSRVSACSAVSRASRPVSPASRASACGRRRRNFSWRSSRSRTGFLGARHEFPPGREAEFPGDDQPRVAKLGGGGVGGGGVPGHIGPQPLQRARVVAAQVGEQGVGHRGVVARPDPARRETGRSPVVLWLWMCARNSAQVRNPCSWASTNWASLSRNRPAARSPSTSADPGPGGRIARLVRALQVLGLLAVVLQVRMGRQLEMTIGHRNLLRRRGPLARPERGWSCPVH